jgi:hypothetical protein
MENTARNCEHDRKSKKVLEIYFEIDTELSNPWSKKKNIFKIKLNYGYLNGFGM